MAQTTPGDWRASTLATVRDLIETAAPGLMSPLRIARCSSSVTRSTSERWAIGRTGAPVRVRAMRFSPSSACRLRCVQVPDVGPIVACPTPFSGNGLPE